QARRVKRALGIGHQDTMHVADCNGARQVFSVRPPGSLRSPWGFGLGCIGLLQSGADPRVIRPGGSVVPRTGYDVQEQPSLFTWGAVVTLADEERLAVRADTADQGAGHECRAFA